jgi:uncharacterized membrane protein HdeD (DUF308 family)
MSMADTGSLAAPRGMLKESAGWGIFLSLLMIAAGLLAILIPPLAGIAVAVLIAWLLTLSGAFHLVFSWHMRTTSGVLWEILIGILYLALGFFLFTRPAVALATLTLFLASYLFMRAVLELISGFRLRRLRGSRWLIVDGVLTLVVGLFILMSWPSSSEWAIGTLIGISMLLSGISRFSLSIGARSAVEP